MKQNFTQIIGLSFSLASYFSLSTAAGAQDFHYTPVFSSDSSRDKTPYSLYQGPRFTENQMSEFQNQEKIHPTPLVTPDLAGVITLRHYEAKKKKSFISWEFWSPTTTTYKVFVQTKDKGNTFSGLFKLNGKRGKITKNRFPKDVSCLAESFHTLFIAGSESAEPSNILAIHLVPEEKLKFFGDESFTKPRLPKPNQKYIHPLIKEKAIERADNSYKLGTTLPQQLNSGKNGYLIITTKEKADALVHLDSFIRHKESRGFKVTVVTEKDFGGGVGNKAADNIRKWLTENYEKHNALYALMLGNPDPDKGDIPYKKVGHKRIDSVFGHSKGKGIPQHPTDYFYVDLDGSWDKNRNGNYADAGDYGAGGINGQPEIYVGRIPYFAPDSEFCNATNVDDILARTIRYENTAGGKAWRHNLFYIGDDTNTLDSFYEDFLRHNGAKLTVNSDQGLLPMLPDIDFVFERNTISTFNKGKFGLVFYQGKENIDPGEFLSPEGVDKLNSKTPTVFALEHAETAAPETPNNLAYNLLNQVGVGVYAANRAVGDYTGNEKAEHTQYYSRLHFGMSTGEALWETRATQAKGKPIGVANFLVNLLGDPSIVPMPQTTGPSTSISPGFHIRLEEPDSLEFEVRNNSSKKKTFTVKAPKGFEVSQTEFTLKSGEFIELEVEIDAEIELNEGENKFTLEFSSGSQKRQRHITIIQ